MNRFIYALGIGCMLSACSTNEDLVPEQKGETGGNANYISIAIVTDEDGTRAEATDPGYSKEDYYDSGTDAEKKVKKLRLYFFDVDGNRVFSKDFASEELKISNTGNAYNPAISTIATIEVELTANRDYHSVVAILNPPSTAPVFSTLTELRNHTDDYAQHASASDSTFTMSNSVYYATESYQSAITSDLTPEIAVPIYTDNIYTHTEIDAIEDATAKATALKNLQNEKAVKIYVERACAKVSVSNKPSFTAHFVDEKGTTNKIKVMGDDGKEKEIEVFAEFRGMDFTVLSKKARVIKKLPAYPQENSPYYFCTHVSDFKWNNPANFRTHWEDAGIANSENYTLVSWKTLADKANTLKETNPLTKYINPNTQDAKNHENDECDFTTKLLVCAQLYFKEGEEKKALDLVRYSGGYWLPSKLINAAAVRIIENLKKMDLSTLSVAEKTMAEEAIESIEVESLTTIGEDDKAAIYLQKLEDANHDYLAELALKEKSVIDPLLGLTGTDEATKKVSTAIRDNMKATLEDMTKREIQYWKDGMTYFYVPVQHVGFPGLMGNLDATVDGKPTIIPNYLNAIVRNHSYQLSIDKIYGMGTPVIDPTDPIDPERPDDAPASYITAKIHVLKWKVVDSKVTLH